jgi:hypothetical protein
MCSCHACLQDARIQTPIALTQCNLHCRPPLAQQQLDPNFDITIDSLDSLTISLSDLGNSGGGRRDEQKADFRIPIRVSALNNAPSANGPLKIKAYEDTPFHFINNPAEVRVLRVYVCMHACSV